MSTMAFVDVPCNWLEENTTTPNPGLPWCACKKLQLSALNLSAKLSSQFSGLLSSHDVCISRDLKPKQMKANSEFRIGFAGLSIKRDFYSWPNVCCIL